MTSQCKEPARFQDGNYHGTIFCILDSGHEGRHSYIHHSEEAPTLSEDGNA